MHIAFSMQFILNSKIGKQIQHHTLQFLVAEDERDSGLYTCAYRNLPCTVAIL